MNFLRYDNSNNKNNYKEDNNKINFHNKSNNKNKTLNYIFSSSNKLFKKESPENENNSDINLNSYKREIIFKLTSFSQEKQQVIFSSGVEEIFDDSKNIVDDKLFYNISNKKFSTPPRNTKSSYKKTKEHIKTPYKTTKSRSSRNKSNNIKENNKSKVSTKSTNYWKSLLYDEEMINNNISQDMNIDINRICNSVIMENPYGNKKEYRTLFCNNYTDDNEEDLNKSI